jgi:hypothetical protein
MGRIMSMGDFGDRASRGGGDGGGASTPVQRSPGKRSLVETRYPVQRRTEQPGADDEQVHGAAEAGLAQPSSALPFSDRIQSSFGRHDVSGIQAHVGGAASMASDAMGAEAYATGNHVAFRGTPDLHTAAHEAAHVVQQRAGVSLKGGVGEEGDPYERHADAVADAVVAGRSAESLLDAMTPSSGGTGSAVQRKNYQQVGLASGLSHSGGAWLNSRTNQANLYRETLTTKATDRTEALQIAAARSARVGNDAIAKMPTGDGKGSVAWTSTPSPRSPARARVGFACATMPASCRTVRSSTRRRVTPTSAA